MKPEDSKSLIAFRMESANQAIRSAEAMLALGDCRASVNRLYYAAFYAANSVLLYKGLAAKRHRGVHALLNEHCVKSGELSEDTGYILAKLFRLRQECDYADWITIEAEDVESNLTHTRYFVEAIRQYLVAKGQLEAES